MKTTKRMKDDGPDPIHLLMEMGQRMISLAEQMGEDGRPLYPQEQELVRMAHLPVLNEIFSDFKAQYLSTGYIDTYELQRFIGK